MGFEKTQILKQALQDNDVQELVKNNNISAEQLDVDFLQVFSYIVSKKKCSGCKGFNQCNQDIIGSMPKLCYNGSIYVEYLPCNYFEEQMNINEKKANLITLACNLDDIDPTSLFQNKPVRNLVYNKMIDIYNKSMNNQSTKGLYLYGPYGCGKSYIMASFANKYAESGKKVVFAYFPDLVRKLKSSITSGNLEDTVDTLKDADVLFLDDFGGETTTAYIRDEVLGAVLQERMENKKLTFITSNLDPKTLHAHLSETSKDIEELKASRVEERIKTLMEFVELIDENYRK